MHIDGTDLKTQISSGFAHLARARREALDRAFREVEDRFENDRQVWLTRTMDGYARRVERTLLPLTWSFDESTGTVTGHAGAEYTDEQAVQVAADWARTFGMASNPTATEGTAEWTGRIGAVDVRVWAVSDRAALFGQHLVGGDR
jgi:hypothetical protein